MDYSKDGLHLTEQFEGCRLAAYRDQGGVLTIGYGHTGPDVNAALVITQEQAENLLRRDVASACSNVNRLVKVPLKQYEFDALVDFVFNCGFGNFLHSTLLRKLNANDFQGAASEFERWDKCGSKEVAGLLRRRQAEKSEFSS